MKGKYIQDVRNLIAQKRSKAIGFLMSGGTNEIRKELLNDILESLQDTNGVVVEHLDLEQFVFEDAKLEAIKRQQLKFKHFTEEQQTKVLILECIDTFSSHTMEVVKLLISCQNLGINLLFSSKSSLVHLVGLSEFIIRVTPSKDIYSDVYRLNKQKTLFTLKDSEVIKDI